MEKVLILNGSDKDKTLRALKAAAKKASGKARAALQGLSEALGGKQPTAGRARRSKEAPSMAKKRTAKRATSRKATTPRRRVHRHNPTTTTAAPAAHHAAPRRARRHSGVASRLKKVNIMGTVTRGACIAGGLLGQSFVARQSERLLPSLPRMAHSLIGSGAVAAAALMLGGGKSWAEDIAAAAVAGGIQGLAHEFMPGMFAGLHEGDVYVQGYEDGAQYAAQAINGYEDEGLNTVQGLEGLAFAGRRIPDDIATRPASL
jgi:hypothetical protein